jgi:fructose/tagatose bisphosphate aldolase
MVSVDFSRMIGGQKVNLVNSKVVLVPAIRNGFAVPFVNVRVFPRLIGDRFAGPSSVRSVINAMLELKAPIGIEIAQSEMKYCGISPEDMVRHVVEEAAKARLAFPIAIHFDHGSDTKKMEANVAAGFTSVAYDGGKCENWDVLLNNTLAWVNYAHPRGISVEGEMETIGGQMATDPVKALEFVTKTGVDILVVAFVKNVHGAAKGTSEIDENLLKEVRRVIPADVALNLHGGSGFSYEVMKRAVGLGISKLNYATEVMKQMLAKTPYEEMLIKLAQVEKEGITNVKDAREKLVKLFEQPDWINMGKDMEVRMEEQGAAEIVRVSKATGNVDTARHY